MNGVAYYDLQYQAYICPIGPMLIIAGTIKINGEKIEMESKRWSDSDFKQAKQLKVEAPAQDVYIGADG